MYGVIAAVPTPIDPAGAPQEDLFLSHCDWLLANGCDGLNILGSTGEANSFDTGTRKQIMRWAAGHLDRSRLMVGTGTPSVAETLCLTEYADDLGYGVALVLPPYYYKPLSDDDLFSWYRSLHEALGDRPIAIYFYNFPQMTGLAIPIPVIQRLHRKWPDRFSGIKDSSGNLDYCRALAASMPALSVFPSSEVALGEAHRSGFAGCISATANQTAALCGRLWKDRASPDGDLVARTGDLRAKISGKSLIPSVKYMVAQRTKQSAWERLLPPFNLLTEDRKSDLDLVACQLSET